MSAQLRITHTREEGTLIDGTAKGDGSAIALKANGWRWGRSIGTWFVPQSRDFPAKTWKINATADALRAAGFSVEVDVDDTARPTAEVEADRAARQADRVAALEAKAERRHGQAEAAQERADRAHAALPPFGEPIKVGHHSENRHRRALDKSWETFGKAVDARAEAAEADYRAAAAAKTTEHRFDAGVTARRIDKLQADRRRLERSRDGQPEWHTNKETGEHFFGVVPASGAYRERLIARISEITDQITYWQAQIDAVKAAGELVFDRTMVRKGDQVKLFGSWVSIVRVNAKTVTVPSQIGSWTDTLPYSKIRAIRDAQGRAVEFVNGVRVENIDTEASA